jgi:hypothetical protein
MEGLRLGVLLVLAGFLTSLGAGIVFYDWYTISDRVVEVQVRFTNGSDIGFNTGTDRLYFGTVAPEGFSERKTTLVSAKESIAVVRLQGDTAQWITVSENRLHLEPNIPHDLHFKLTAPSDAVPGEYTGTVIITYHRRMFWE